MRIFFILLVLLTCCAEQNKLEFLQAPKRELISSLTIENMGREFIRNYSYSVYSWYKLDMLEPEDVGGFCAGVDTVKEDYLSENDYILMYISSYWGCEINSCACDIKDWVINEIGNKVRDTENACLFFREENEDCSFWDMVEYYKIQEHTSIVLDKDVLVYYLIADFKQQVKPTCWSAATDNYLHEYVNYKGILDAYFGESSLLTMFLRRSL